MKATVPRTFSVVSRTFSSVGWTLSPTTLLTLRRVATLRPPMTIVRMIAMRKSTVPAMVKLPVVEHHRLTRRHRPLRRIEPHLHRAPAHRHRRRRRLAPVADARRRPEPPLRRLAGDERQLLGD